MNGEQLGGPETIPAPPVDNFVDSTHKYTKVTSVGERGPGNAFKTYNIFKKADYNKPGDDAQLAAIHFQNGPIKEAGINGVMDENLLTILIDRLEGFQSGPYSCEENAEALTSIQYALAVLEKRTAGREARGVEGTHEV